MRAGRKILAGLRDALTIVSGGKPHRLSGRAMWRYDFEAEAWYIDISPRRPGPYRTQRHVEAIIDIADDGYLAGVEIIDDKCPEPYQPWRRP